MSKTRALFLRITAFVLALLFASCGGPPTPAPVTPTASLTVSMGTATATTQPATLSWNAADVPAGGRVELNGQPVAASGTRTDNLSVTTTYTLVVKDSADVVRAQDSKTATVQLLPVVQTPTASLSISMGAATTTSQPAILNWNTTNVPAGGRVELNGQVVAAAGTRIDNLTQTTTYVLVIKDSAGVVKVQDSKVASVTLAQATADPTATLSVTMGTATTTSQPAVLSWSAANVPAGGRVELNGQVVAVSGTRTDNLTTTTPYTLVVKDSAGVVKASDTKTADVTLAQPTPTATLSYTLGTATTTYQPATLTWSSTNVPSGGWCELNNVTVACTGTRTDNLSADTTYTFTVKDASGVVKATDSKFVDITLTPAPITQPYPVNGSFTQTSNTQTNATGTLSFDIVNPSNVNYVTTVSTPEKGTITLPSGQTQKQLTLSYDQDATITVTYNGTAKTLVVPIDVTLATPVPTPTATLSYSLGTATTTYQPATLTWSSTNVPSGGWCELNNVTVTCTGTRTDNLSADTTYTFTVKDASGVVKASDSKFVDVTLTPAPKGCAAFADTSGYGRWEIVAKGMNICFEYNASVSSGSVVIPDKPSNSALVKLPTVAQEIFGYPETGIPYRSEIFILGNTLSGSVREAAYQLTGDMAGFTDVATMRKAYYYVFNTTMLNNGTNDKRRLNYFTGVYDANLLPDFSIATPASMSTYQPTSSQAYCQYVSNNNYVPGVGCQ